MWGSLALAAIMVMPVAARASAASPDLPCAAVDRVGTRTSYRGCELRLPRSVRDGTARDFLRAYASALGMRPDTADLEEVQDRHGLVDHTTRFRQTLDGVPILDAWVVVTRGENGALRSLHSSYRAIPRLAGSATARLSAKDAAAIAQTALAATALRLPTRATPAWLPDADGTIRLVWEVWVYAREPLGDFHVLVTADTGDVVLKENRMAFAHGFVYAPNPVQVSGNTSLVDDDDRTNANLDAARVDVPLLGLDPDTALLRGEYVDLVSLGGGLPVPNASDPDRVYQYDRDDPRFEQVVVYYTIDFVQRYMHALGFDDASGTANGIRDFPTLVNAHWDDDDQSFYSTGDDALHFGDGGVDDAEDADIVVHEFGHAIQHDQNACWGGGEMGAMGEGFGDYLAASIFSDRGNAGYQAENAACVGEWDATAYSAMEPPCLRRVDGSKKYPDDLVRQVHADGEIWSAALWDLRAAVGRFVADRLVLDHHFHLPCGATMFDGAQALIQSDFDLHGGSHEAAIRDAFCKRGILTGSECPVPATLRLGMTGAPEPVEGGAALTFTLTATNNTLSSLTGVSLSSPLPTNASYVAGSASNGGSLAKGAILWPAVTMAPGASFVRSYAVRVAPGLMSTLAFADDMESGGARWRLPLGTGENRWELTDDVANSGTRAWFAADVALVADQQLALAQPIRVPPHAVLRFAHRYTTESTFDGGVVEISSDGQVWTDAGALMFENGYDATINPAFNSPIAGREAFTGDSGGFIETALDLSSYEGTDILVRFRMATDTSVASTGWYVDDVRLIGESRVDTSANVSSNEGESADATASILVALPPPACGDGILDRDGGEECDDGNLDGGDCCTADCRFDVPGSSCSDGDVCNGKEICGISGVCLPGKALACSDEDPCTDDSCDATDGCTHEFNTAPCSDGNACNGLETCDGAGSCKPGQPLACNDGNPCTTDSCDTATGCRHLPNTAPCPDGDACNGAETCMDGACQPAAPLECDDHNVCTDDSCAPASGCVHAPNDAPCGGGACYEPGTCAGASCQGTPLLECNDQEPCTDDYCDAVAGCVHEANHASCSDGDPCNGDEVCSGGTCTAGVPPDCDDGNPCTDDGCHPLVTCFHIPNSLPCPDGNHCNGDEYCSSGSCHPGTPLNCNDDVCVEGRCSALDSLRTSAATITAVRNVGTDNDTLSIKAFFSLDDLTVLPTAGGLEIFLIDGEMDPIFAARLPAADFFRRGTDGNTYKFIDRAGAVVEANGVRSARVRLRPASNSVKVRIVVNRFEIPANAFRSTLSVTLLFGDDASGDCITGLGLACAATTTSLRCDGS
jgi:uncharacterized repeat protein (TIGR01451 family)